MHMRMKRPSFGRIATSSVASAVAAALTFGAATAANADDTVVDETTPSEVLTTEVPAADPIVGPPADPPVITPGPVVEEVTSAPVVEQVVPAAEEEAIVEMPVDQQSAPVKDVTSQVTPALSTQAPETSEITTQDDPASVPELRIESFTLLSRDIGVPNAAISLQYRPNTDPSLWTTPGVSSLTVTVRDSKGNVVGVTNAQSITSGGLSDTYFLDPGDYSLDITVPLTGGGTTVVFEENFTVAGPVTDPDPIVVERPEQIDENVIIPDIPGVEFFEVGTGVTLTPGTHSAFPQLTLDARPSPGSDRPVTGGPWSYTWTPPEDPDPQPEPQPEPGTNPGLPNLPGTDGPQVPTSPDNNGEQAGQAGGKQAGHENKAANNGRVLAATGGTDPWWSFVSALALVVIGSSILVTRTVTQRRRA